MGATKLKVNPKQMAAVKQKINLEDVAQAERFEKIISKVKEVDVALGKAEAVYAKRLDAVVSKSAELKKLRAEVDALSKSRVKQEEVFEKFVRNITAMLKSGFKSLFFTIDVVLSTRRSVSYKSVCDQLVKDGVVPQGEMDKYFDRFDSRKETEKMTYKGKEIYEYITDEE